MLIQGCATFYTGEPISDFLIILRIVKIYVEDFWYRRGATPPKQHNNDFKPISITKLVYSCKIRKIWYSCCFKSIVSKKRSSPPHLQSFLRATKFHVANPRLHTSAIISIMATYKIRPVMSHFQAFC